MQRTGAVEAYEVRKSPKIDVVAGKRTKGPSLCNEMTPKYE